MDRTLRDILIELFDDGITQGETVERDGISLVNKKLTRQRKYAITRAQNRIGRLYAAPKRTRKGGKQ